MEGVVCLVEKLLGLTELALGFAEEGSFGREVKHAFVMLQGDADAVFDALLYGLKVTLQLVDIGREQLGGGAGRGGAEIGHEVADGEVDLMPDGGDDGNV